MIRGVETDDACNSEKKRGKSEIERVSEIRAGHDYVSGKEVRSSVGVSGRHSRTKSS